MDETKVCKYCFNARVNTKLGTDVTVKDPFGDLYSLTDMNDASSITIGKCQSDHTMFINSGMGRPVNISFSQLAGEGINARWQDVGIYIPKYCPECGRYLVEDGYEEYEEH